jgi:hypothetical protein
MKLRYVRFVYIEILGFWSSLFWDLDILVSGGHKVSYLIYRFACGLGFNNRVMSC